MNKTLTIKGSGSLNATGGLYGAGIGGGYKIGCGDINITGGIITATGGYHSAGIGGGDSAGCGNIGISGKDTDVMAYGGVAGIGSGGSGTCGNITISGGMVNASAAGSGIGCGDNGSCGDITISGGIVNAAGGVNDDGTLLGNSTASGIGVGHTGSGGTSTCGDITITDGVTCVTAVKADKGYSISGNTVTIGGKAVSVSESPYEYFPTPFITGKVTTAEPFYDGQDSSGNYDNGATAFVTDLNMKYDRTSHVTIGSVKWTIRSGEEAGSFKVEAGEGKELPAITLYAQSASSSSTAEIVLAVNNLLYTGGSVTVVCE